jgi:selenocysteine lyase/cysteine desulfurase
MIYLNHASHGPLPTPARDAYERFLDSWQKTRHEHDGESFVIIEDTRRELAAMIESDPERICLTSTTSYGLNIVAAGYLWKPGDSVVISRCEFPAVVYPWLRLRDLGVDIKFADGRDGYISEDNLISMCDERTRVMAVSWVQFNNGFRINLDKLGAFCRENNILFCVDGIQGMGVVPVNVPSHRIDLFTCGCQKWMLGPCGTGFFYLSEQAESRLRTPLAGWLSVDWGVDFTNLMRYDLQPRNGAARYELGTYPYQDIRALAASVGFLNSFDQHDKWEHIKSLTDKIFDLANSNPAVRLLSSPDDSRRSGIVSIATDNTKGLFEFLMERGFALSFREGGIRISPYFHNSTDEIGRLTESIVQFSG